MKKLLFMMFLMGGITIGFTSCGGGEESEETTESAEEGAEETEEAAHQNSNYYKFIKPCDWQSQAWFFYFNVLSH